MRNESISEMRERLEKKEREKWRMAAAKELVRQDVIRHINRRKTDEERKRDAEFEDLILGKNATLNEREAFRGALTKKVIEKMTNNEDAIKYARDRSDHFVERWTGNKSSNKKNTEEKKHGK